ncbi:LysR family transcriptional regulator [Gymnodinialimonas sp.]
MERLPSAQTLRRMTYFAAIAEAGSIRGAARRLRLSVPVISGALAELEAELGVSLAVRTTRSFRLTEAGERVREKAAGIVALMAQTQTIGAPDRPLTGRLAMSVPVELAAHWLPPILAQFRAAHPRVQLHVDSNDGVVNLGDSAVDLAVRATMADHGLPLACVMARGADPAHLPLLGGGGQNGRVRARKKTTGEEVTLELDGAIAVNDKSTAREMVRAGLGAALLIDLGLDDGFVSVDPRLDFGAVALEVILRDPLPSAEVTAFLAMDAIRGLPVVPRGRVG